jgi:beta-glucosidase/6-phospho-beta-glucosidase/beta-galactosidase
MLQTRADNPFKSSLLAGFECSTHRIRSGKRLDMIAATWHDEFADQDYRRLTEIGILTARDGLRWHLIELEPYRYDFDSAMSQVRAARRNDIQIIWDLFHYGYPDDLDILSHEFVERFAAFAGAAARFLRDELGSPIHFCPVNEISFFSWAAGRVGIFYPYRKRAAGAIKLQLVRASIAAIDAVLEVDPHARWITTEPAIHVVPSEDTPTSRRAAARYRQAQFEGLDMLSGSLAPELGGNPRYIDIVGLNYYVHNQWKHSTRRPIGPNHPQHRAPHLLFNEFYKRYGRPILLAETGIEDEERADWFRYISAEAHAARAIGVPLHGLCLYPIVNHPGWEDGRHCHNGLWDYPDDEGDREAHGPLLAAVRAFQMDQAVPAIEASPV